MPRVSIITPAYNAESTLAEAIESVLAQSFSDWELLIVDDGSRDETARVAERYDDRRVKLFRQPNQGVSAARNRALEAMRGEYFTFLDADDLLPPHALASYMEGAALSPQATFLAGCVEIVKEGSGQVSECWRPRFHGDPLSPLIRIDSRVFFGVCLLVRRSVGFDYQFERGLSHCEDLLFFADIAAALESPLYVSLTQPTYIRKERTGSSMSSLEGLENGYRAFYHAVKRFPRGRVAISDILYLKLRYVRIMMLSHLRSGSPWKAAKMLLDLVGLR